MSKSPKLPPPWKPSTRPPRNDRQIIVAYTPLDGDPRGSSSGFFHKCNWYWTGGGIVSSEHYTVDAWCELPPHPAAKKRRAK